MTLQAYLFGFIDLLSAGLFSTCNGGEARGYALEVEAVTATSLNLAL